MATYTNPYDFKYYQRMQEKQREREENKFKVPLPLIVFKNGKVKEEKYSKKDLVAYRGKPIRWCSNPYLSQYWVDNLNNFVGVTDRNT